MPNQKLKSENYQNIGGINTKTSQYQNTLMEFLDLKNFDFQTIAALNSRWGSTQYVTQTFGNKISSLYEYSKLSGASYVVIGHTGGVWFGATTGNSQGMSFTLTGVTTSTNLIGFPYFRGTTNTATYAPLPTPVRYLGISNSPVYFQGDAFTMNRSPFINGANNLDFATFTDYMFAADGQKFLKFDGSTATTVGLPPPGAINVSVLTGASQFLSNITLGCYMFFASYVNTRGFESQIWPVAYFDCFTGYVGSNGITIGQVTATLLPTSVLLSTPLAYGISSINLYSYYTPTLMAAVANSNYQNNWNPNYVFRKNVAASGSTMTSVDLGATTGGLVDVFNNVGSAPDLSANTYQPMGMTLYYSSSAIINTVSEVNILPYAPRYLEVYKDRIFTAGFSSAPSTVWYSDVGEPEGFSPLNSFEVRTNDGDYVTGLRAYGTRIYIFKKNSFHSLQGDGAANYYLQELSTNYGCLNNNCAVIYDDVLLFLDRSGLMMYGGAKLESVSNKVQNYFDRLNYNTALNIAIMVHDKLRNQILIAMPIDGSTSNNITLVYDYLVKAWTTYDGYNPTVFAKIQGRNTTENAFYGSFSGTVNWFGPSFFSDNGVGFTAYFKTRFLHDMGESVQKQFRRLYINADSIGSTLNMPINFFQDYGSSTVLSTTFSLGQFQNRIDFGISGKSLAFELFNLRSDSPLRIYGFTIESRMQRMV